MEDDKIKGLFEGFAPQLSSDSQFLDKLQRELDGVEFVKQSNAKALRRNRRALVVAALTGLVVGFGLAQAVPYIGAVVEGWSKSPSSSPLLLMLVDNCFGVAWLMVGLLSAFIAFNTYEISLVLQSRKRRA